MLKTKVRFTVLRVRIDKVLLLSYVLTLTTSLDLIY